MGMDELLFYGGAVTFVLSIIFFVVSMAVFAVWKRKLKKTLEKEYGPKMK